MKCAVAIVLALIGLAMAHPAPIGIGLAQTPLVIPSAVSVSSSVINHGLTLPRVSPIISYPIIKTPIITPIVKSPIITAPIITVPIIKSVKVAPIVVGGLGYGLH